MCSVRRTHARPRILAATLPGTTWPLSLDLLDSTFVVYMAWSPLTGLFYIGKTNDFRERLRRHINGFLRQASSHPQPYMVALIAAFKGDAPAALASLVYIPIARCYSEEAALRLEHYLINSEHPPLNEPYVQKLLSLPVPMAFIRTRPLSSGHVTPLARFSQGRAFPQELLPRAPAVRTALSSAHTAPMDAFHTWAQAACNTLGKPQSGRIRRELFKLSPTEWFQVWRRVRRAEGLQRTLGLLFLDRVRRFRNWPLPRLVIRATLPWLPQDSHRVRLHDMLLRVVAHARHLGQVVILPAFRDLRFTIAPKPASTIRSMLRNAPAFYRTVSAPQACMCHLHPHLPRLPSPDGRLHVYAPQDTWRWPPEVEYMRTLPAHTVVRPSKHALIRSCLACLRSISRQLGVRSDEAFLTNLADEIGVEMFTKLSDLDLDFSPVPTSHVLQVRKLMHGLVIEEFQKTKHVLVAECPARAQTLTFQAFGADGAGHHFRYYPELDSDVILHNVSHVPDLREALQPACLSRRSTWRMAAASAPNKKRSKPDDRRPIVNRSHWPTNGIDTPVARALDWMSTTFLPRHLHIDVSRTDDFRPSVEEFNSMGSTPHASGKVGGDIVSCFTNIPHHLVHTAWHFYRSCMADNVDSISAPKRHRRGRARPGAVTACLAHLFVNLMADDMEAVIVHHLRTGWFTLGGLLGREIEGLPMGSALAGALTRMVLIYCDITFYSLTRPPPAPGHHARMSTVYIAGVQVTLLETRYVDDCITLWKCYVAISAATASLIEGFLWDRLCRRYPLEIERDVSDKFVGLMIGLDAGCRFSTQPLLHTAPSTYSTFDFPAFMSYRSFTSRSIKRSIVLGIVARVDAYTTPVTSKATVLQEFLRRLITEGEFPEFRLRRWARDAGQRYRPWVREALTDL